MDVKIKFAAAQAKRVEYFLRQRYASRAGLQRLVKIAVLEAVAAQAQKEVEETINNARKHCDAEEN
jgi:hypothetical protein